MSVVSVVRYIDPALSDSFLLSFDSFSLGRVFSCLARLGIAFYLLAINYRFTMSPVNSIGPALITTIIYSLVLRPQLHSRPV